MAGGRPSFLARTNSLTTFQSCVLAWAIRPSMLLLVSSRMAIWTVGVPAAAAILAPRPDCGSTTRRRRRHETRKRARCASWDFLHRQKLANRFVEHDAITADRRAP